MEERASGRRARTTEASWIRRNLIDAAPQWLQLLRSALANVRIS